MRRRAHVSSPAPSSPALTTCTHLGGVIAARRLAQASHVFGFRQLGKHMCGCMCALVCSCVSRSLLTEFIPFHCQVVFHGGERHSCGFQLGLLEVQLLSMFLCEDRFSFLGNINALSLIT